MNLNPLFRAGENMTLADLIQPRKTVETADFKLDENSVLNMVSEELPILGSLMGVDVSYKCGWCNHLQDTRIPVRDYPVVRCSYCHTYNQFPLTRKGKQS